MSKNLTDYTVDELAVYFIATKQKLEELEAYRGEVQAVLLDKLRELNLTGVKTKDGYFVKRITSTIYSGVSLSTARELNAIRVEEKVDSGKLKEMTETGIQIPGVRQITYIKVEESE